MARKPSLAAKNARELRADLNGGSKSNKLISVVADLYGGPNDALMPGNLLSAGVFQSTYGAQTGCDRFRQARTLAGAGDAPGSEFFGGLIYFKEIFFNDGFQFRGQKAETGGAKSQKKTRLQKWLDGQVIKTDEGTERPYDFARIVSDAWQEWLICDNIVAFWRENDGDQLPIVTILDCEICDYKNLFGVETLKIKVPKVSLSKDELARYKAKGMDKRYLDAIEKGQALTLDEEQGERFRVLTRAKLGRGLASPRVELVLNELAALELLGLGNWAAASQMANVVRQIAKGHETRGSGPNAGTSANFMKAREAVQIKNSLKNKRGAFDMLTNFDVKVLFPFLDPKYFDAKKFEGTLARLENWGGPVTKLLLSGQISPFVMDMFGTEGRRQRQLVGDFLLSIFNDPSFLGKLKPPGGDLVPQWNPRSFTTQKMLIELGRFLYTDGLGSPQTLRPWFELDDREEGDRLEEASRNKKRFTPPFEAKQGIVSGKAAGAVAPGDGGPGGRPNESPGG